MPVGSSNLFETANSARLLRYNLQTTQMTLVTSWPLSAAYDRFFLENALNGELLLASSSASTARHCVAVLALGPGGVSARWGLIADGTLALEPTLTAAGLARRIKRTTGVAFDGEFIPTADLPANQSFSAGACL